MSIDLSKQENCEKLGKILLRFEGESDSKASIVYVDGIPHFDKKLAGHKFEETDCRILLEIYENGIIFILSNKYYLPFVYAGIYNKDMLSMEIIDNVPISVPEFSRLKNALPWAPIGGAIGTVIANYRRDKAQYNKELNIIGTREVIGGIVKLYYIDDKDELKKTITFKLLKEDHYDKLKALFQKYWKDSVIH